MTANGKTDMDNKNIEDNSFLKNDPCYGCRHAVTKMHRIAVNERQLECFRTGELEPCLETTAPCCYEKGGKK